VANPEHRLSTNAPGPWFVDQACIDCDLCRQLSPSIFGDEGGQACIRRQPISDDDQRQAALAAIACPTGAIGAGGAASWMREARGRFPLAVGDGVYFCGYASRDSYGASSWLVVRPDGNVLVDSPRASRAVMEGLAALGGVRWMFLTHRDDVADHSRFHERFGCERILHVADLSTGTRVVERVLRGRDPSEIAPGLLAIPVPGHTRGSTALLFQERVLFSGDHLWGSSSREGLAAGREVCWWSWEEQIRSMERLVAHRFDSVRPGHGRPYRAASPEAMRAELQRLVVRMRSVS
jgi:glyoxylase-like metal-dependent hydrolase (beta-lactamase superfamily II)/ferredoxin